jgi:ABC-2 type transport system permease protein
MASTTNRWPAPSWSAVTAVDTTLRPETQALIPPGRLARTRALLRLELADALRSRWLLFTCGVYALVFGAFVWFGLRESSVLGFTGLSRVVLSVANAVVIVVPLVALVATSQGIVRAKQTGLFELLLVQPCRRGEWFAGLVASRLVVLGGPLVLMMAIAGLLGAILGEGAELAVMLTRSLLVSLALLVCFIGIGLLLSAWARSPERATVLALGTWLVAAAMHDFALIGVLLRMRMEPAVVFTLAAANPVEAARVAVLTGVDPELSVLGPVGFWIANTLGSRMSLAVGTLWPLFLGVLALGLAARRLRRMDLVG